MGAGWLHAAGSYMIRTVAGGDFVGDGGPAVAALLFAPEGIALDAAGNLYVADPADHRVRKITPAGLISTVAGNGHAGFSGDGGPAATAQLNRPYGLAVDAAGNLYIADLGNGRVRRVGVDGVIHTVAGGGATSAPGTNPPATSVRLVGPRNLALDRAGNLYISDFPDHRVYVMTRDGRIQVVAGTGAPGMSGDGGPAVYAQLNYPAGLTLDAAGNLYIADSGNRRVRRLAGGILSTVSTAVTLDLPTGLAFDLAGNLLVADGRRIVRVTPSGAATVLATPARDLTVDGAAGICVVSGTPQVQRVTSSGATVIAGATATPRFWGDGGPATSARLNSPHGLALSPDGSLWIADTGNARVRRITAGIIATVAGSGFGGQTAEGIPAAQARLAAPTALAVDRAGNVWIADSMAHRIRRVGADGRIFTAAGTGEAGFNGDGLAAALRLNQPTAVAVDEAGNVFIAEAGNHRVRKLGSDGILVTVAGSGLRGYAGDGGPAVQALLDGPAGLALDAEGNLYIADRRNHVVRKVDRTGVIWTVAGTGAAGFAGDGGPAIQARLNYPSAVAVDREGNLYIADTENHRVRRVTREGIIETIAGEGTPGYGGDDGPATQARLFFPTAVAVDAEGNVFVADQDNHRIRQLVRRGEASAAMVETLTVVNAASLLPGPVAPGQLVTIFAPGLGPETPQAAKLDGNGTLEKRIGDWEVLWDGKPAPLLYLDRDQINVQAPYGIAGLDRVRLEVRRGGAVAAQTAVPVAQSAPALFTLGQGQAAAINEDGTVNSADRPARRGSVVTLFATGEGLTDPPSVEGRPAAAPWPRPKLPVSLTIGVHAAEILFVGSAPGMVGVLQINARVPGGFTPAGLLPVELMVGDARSQPGVRLAVQ